jgi:endonuclease/exonuclease/phosphatase family metal-dependent hydrolase
MTYNIHGAVGRDRRSDPSRVLDVITEINPTVLGLQEVRTGQNGNPGILDIIELRSAGYYTLFLETLTDSQGAYGNALVTRHPVTDHIDVSLEAPPRAYTSSRPPEARRAIFARLDLHGTPVWVIVTHLAVERRFRRRQANTLLDAIDAHTRLEREPAIFLGDFNEWRRPNGFHRNLDRRFSRNVIRRTFPASFPILPLDRIWLTPHFTRHNTYAHKSAAARRASDHLPLVTECSMD